MLAPLPRVPSMPHVDDADARELPVIHAVEQGGELVLAGHGVLVALHGGGGAAEQDGAALQVRAVHRDVPRMVARRILLLVGVLVLFIHDDEPEPLQRGEDGAARADDDAGRAVVDLVPFVVALAVGEMAVQYRHLLLRDGRSGS